MIIDKTKYQQLVLPLVEEGWVAKGGVTWTGDEGVIVKKLTPSDRVEFQLNFNKEGSGFEPLWIVGICGPAHFPTTIEELEVEIKKWR